MEWQKAKRLATHEKIVAVAGRVIRRGGFEAITVANIMKDVGLTHGGFYLHFASRDTLLEEALAEAAEDGFARIVARAGRIEATGSPPLDALIRSYLSEAHLLGPEEGCAVAALGSQFQHQPMTIRVEAEHRVKQLVQLVQARMPTTSHPECAPALTSQLVGAIQLARATVDCEAAQDFLYATRSEMLRRYAIGAPQCSPPATEHPQLLTIKEQP